MKQSLQIVGILNVTPDSYYDGGKHGSIDAAAARAGEMLEEGADWIEIGGESTGPNSKNISIDEELARTIPVIEAIRTRYPNAKLSIDTYKAEIAEQAIVHGVTMVNDVTAGRGGSSLSRRGAVRVRGSEHMFNILKNTEAHIVLMYSKDPTPRTTIQNTPYKDVIQTVKKFLKERMDTAIRFGIEKNRIILDPGMGHFISSDPTYSLEMIARLSELQELGCPLLLSPSRKSFLAGSEDLKPPDRLPGTIAASAIAVLHGASYIRTHDVQGVRRGCEVAFAIKTSLQ